MNQSAIYNDANNTTLDNATVDSLRESHPASQRVLVALDASPQSLAALEAAGALASLLRAEICGIFVEDADLERLCSLPFSAEVGAYSATARALTDFCISREFHALEKGIRLALQRVAQVAGVPWSLQVARGGVTAELLNAAAEASVLSMGRIGWSQRNQMGSTAATVMRQTRRPLLLPAAESHTYAYRLHSASSRSRVNQIKVIYTGTDAADRALSLAQNLAINSGRQLVVYVITDSVIDSAERNHASEKALAHAQVVSLDQRGTSHILNTLQASQPGVTVLSDADARLTMALIDGVADPVLLVA